MSKLPRFRDFNVGTSIALTEELHHAIRGWLDGSQDNAANLHNKVTANIRTIAKRGEDTGLEDGKPKKGSSRAVYFPKEPHKTVVDGKEVQIPSALKIAYEGTLDKHRERGESLLGEHQNAQENSYHAREYGVLKPVSGDNHRHSFETNPHGVFVPVLDHHDDHHWYLHGRVDKLGAGDFQSLTKTKEFPKGISHKDFYDAVNLHHDDAHGTSRISGDQEAHLRNIQTHPFVENVTDAMFSTGMHPGDLTKSNMGVWNHPITGQKHLVVSDYGYSNEVPKLYQKLRQRHARSKGW